jgi:hypothetical protein
VKVAQPTSVVTKYECAISVGSNENRKTAPSAAPAPTNSRPHTNSSTPSKTAIAIIGTRALSRLRSRSPAVKIWLPTSHW